MRNIIAFLLLLIIGNSLEAQNAFITDSLDRFITREMKRWQIPGLAITIVKDGKTVVCKGYGTREINSGGNVNENSLFQIASNSKAFTATSLSLLDYQKRITLDDKVTKWIKDFKLNSSYTTSETTIRDLLCHRIGFGTFQSDLRNWGSNLTRKELISGMQNVVPKNGFREKYGYCNVAFLTAGEIIPFVTDTTWDDFLKYHFFQPLKMSHTYTHWEDIASDDNACKPHTMNDNKLEEMPFVNVDNLGPAGSINSCAKDLSHWLLMQLDSGRYEGRQIFPFKVLQATRMSQMVIGDNDNKTYPGKHFNNYGLGWRLEDYSGVKVISHTGASDGYLSTTCFVPELKLGLAVLTNTDVNELFNVLRYMILDAYLGLPYRNYSETNYEAAEKSRKEDREEILKWKSEVSKMNKCALPLRDFEGTYTNPVYGTVEISGNPPASMGKRDANRLYLYFGHHPKLTGTLNYMEGNRFLCIYNNPEYGIKTLPFEIEKGKVKSITVRVNPGIDPDDYIFIKQ